MISQQEKSAFLIAWQRTGRAEGGFVNHVNDSGGATNHGITEQVARAHGYVGHMQDLPAPLAERIAKAQYWDLMRLDDVANLSIQISFEMFDAGFLSGQATVVKWLQRCLNVGNRAQRDYPDIQADGLMGPVSVASLRAYLDKRGRDGEIILLNAMNGLESAHFTELAERREKDESFWNGWQLKRGSPHERSTASPA